MKKTLLFYCLLPLLSFGAENVYTDRQRVELPVSGGEALRLVDQLGRETAIPATGLLPCGYYDIYRGGERIGGFPVVPAEYPNDRNSRLGVDYAMATSTDLPNDLPRRIEILKRSADLAVMAGVRNVRERVTLSRGIRRKADGGFVFDEPRTLEALKAAHQAGLNVCAFFQNMPKEVGRDGKSLRTPDRLADSYRVIEAAARAAGPYLDAWEIYNEMDLRNFYEGTAWEYAAFAKAAALAIRRHDPDAKILLGAFATSTPGFRRILNESGVAGYYDFDNLHSYAGGEALNRYLASRQRGLLRPAHATETGLHLPAWQVGDKRDYPEESSRRTASLLGSIYAETLASGCEKAYFFIWRFYWACGSILDRDFNPTLRFAALATANAQFGNGIYLGSQVAGDVRTHLFDTGKGRRTLVICPTKTPGAIRVKARGRYTYTCSTGEVIASGEALGEIELATGSDTRYLQAGEFPDDYPCLALPRPMAAPPLPETVVIEPRVIPEPAYDMGTPAYEVDPGTVLTGEARIWNFGEKTVSGKVAACLEGDWLLEAAGSEVTVKPGDFGTVRFQLTAPAESDLGRREATLRFSMPGAAPAALNFALRYEALKPARIVPAFEVPPAQLRWQTGGYSRELVNPQIHGSSFRIDFLAPGARMFWPSLKELPNQSAMLDWRGFDALRIKLRVKSTRPGSWFMATLTEPQGSRYNSTRILVETPGEHELLYVFSYFVYYDSVPDDPLFTLDLDRIAGFALGFQSLSKYRENFQESYPVEYDIAGVDLIKY